MLAAFAGLFLSSLHFSSPVENFHPVHDPAILKSVGNYMCAGQPGFSRKECLEDFRKHGLVWSAGVNGHGKQEVIVFGGNLWAGSGGRNYDLLVRRGNEWESVLRWCDLDEPAQKPCVESWQTMRLRTDILPIVRGGYHDLRIEVDHCIKWDGSAYVDYKPEDYHQLLPAWFDDSDPNEAEIFWAIRYAGRDHFQFEPQWFPIDPDEFREPRKPGGGIAYSLGDFPRSPHVFLDDPLLKLRWVGMTRGGMWGVKGDRAYLLNPRLAYLGTDAVRLQGEWLWEFESAVEVEEEPGTPIARYNRVTHEFKFEHPAAEYIESHPKGISDQHR